MTLPGKLCVGILEEDNPLKSYFRFKPMLVSEEGGYRPFSAGEAFPEEGCLRIVPDKNESGHFKARMRRIGRYAMLDLRAHAGENDKIRPNKNYHADPAENNAYIVYSDVVVEPPSGALFEIVDRAVPEDSTHMALTMPLPGTQRVLFRGEEGVSPVLWRVAPMEDVEGAVELSREEACVRPGAGAEFAFPAASGEMVNVLIAPPGASLLEGEEVETPVFNFTTGKREAQGTANRLEPGQPLIIEGIHGLNPLLAQGLPQEQIHRIFVSALTCVNLDDHNRIRTTDARLLRRVVRDHLFRGTSPEETVAMWPSVRRGEENYIFPYQEEADAMFNSALPYELPILKRYAYSMLSAIGPDSPCYTRARRLVKFLNYFRSADVEDEIPPNSILREFIGGCCFYRETD